MSVSFGHGEAWARGQDEADPLRGLRDEFEIPPRGVVAGLEGQAKGDGAGGSERSGGAREEDGTRDGGGEPEGVRGALEPCIYMCGNSLGCMPRRARQMLAEELDDWSRLGVEGHLHGRRPWYSYHEQVRAPLARLVGAMPTEVVCMNTLTVNLHLMMASFYRPTRERFRIVIEDSAFPSDSYAVQSQADFHARSVGFDASKAVVRLRPREGEQALRTEDIEALLEREGGSIALVMLGAVNYLTGQFFDMPAITRAAHRAGAVAGWDLAHAAGNLPLRLHDWNADFAVWCSYKYLNGGPGAVAGAFVHERHHGDRSLPRLSGWWGNDPATRFRMESGFVPVASADAWALSNPPIFSMTPLVASFELFDRAGMEALRAKSVRLTGYLEWLIDELNRSGAARITVVTPRRPEQRGCHLSLAIEGAAKAKLEALRAAGVVCDFREPNVIRVAPVPLYNTFADVYWTARALSAV